MIALRFAVRTEAFAQRSVAPHQRAIYCLNFLNKWNDLFGAYRTERPVPNIFGMNTCTVTPLLMIYIKFQTFKLKYYSAPLNSKVHDTMSSEFKSPPRLLRLL